MLQLLFNIFVLLALGFLYYKFTYFHKNIIVFINKATQEFLKFRRLLSREQGQIYSSFVCSKCGSLLPEGSLRTHEGIYLCSFCKTDF